MKTLEEIEQEIGKETFKRWKSYVTHRMSGTCYRWMPSAARQAYVFEEMQRLYMLREKTEVKR